jgi:alpha,alpha-trehalose phosphorylase (configuration-retaining)
VYLHDFCVKHLELDGSEDKHQDVVTDYIIKELSCYERRIFCKFIGAGVPFGLSKIAHKLCSRLWAELDIVPIALRRDQGRYGSERKSSSNWDTKCIDEQADSMARKCIM